MKKLCLQKINQTHVNMITTQFSI